MRILLGSITKLKDVEVIVNASNGLGIMGAGVAGAIARAAGEDFKHRVRNHCLNKINKHPQAYGYFEGDCFVSDSGLLEKQGVKKIYHAVTMRNPGGKTSLPIIKKALKTTLELAEYNKVSSIAVPALGTGIGGLDKKDVAREMINIIQEHEKYSTCRVTLIDIDTELVDYAKSFLV